MYDVAAYKLSGLVKNDPLNRHNITATTDCPKFEHLFQQHILTSVLWSTNNAQLEFISLEGIRPRGSKFCQLVQNSISI